MSAALVRNRRMYQRIITSKVMHPQARSVNIMQRNMRHHIKMESIAKKGDQLWVAIQNRFRWFKEQLQEVYESGELLRTMAAEAGTSAPLTLQAATLAWIRRFDDGIAAMKQERNPPQGTIRKLLAAQEAEMIEFKSGKGYLVPEVTTEEGLRSLFEFWDGSLPGVRKVKSIRVQLSVKPEQLPAFTVKDFLEDDADVDAAEVAEDAEEDTALPKKKFRVSTKARLMAAKKRAIVERKGAKSVGKNIGTGKDRRKISMAAQRERHKHRQLALSRGLL